MGHMTCIIPTIMIVVTIHNYDTINLLRPFRNHGNVTLVNIITNMLKVYIYRNAYTT